MGRGGESGEKERKMNNTLRKRLGLGQLGEWERGRFFLIFRMFRMCHIATCLSLRTREGRGLGGCEEGGER